MKHIFHSVVAAISMSIAASTFAIDIVVVSHGQANDPFHAVIKNGINKAAKDTGVHVEYRAPETFDMVAMSQMIDAAVNQEPDGLVVTIADADALGPSIERAVAAGIPVISMNSGTEVSKALGALLHVGQDAKETGRLAGEKLRKMGGSKAICVNHEVGNVSLDLRCEGFAEGFGGKVTVLPTSNDPADIEAKVRAALESDPAIDTIMTLGAATAGEPSVAAIQSLDKGDGQIKIGSFDLSSDFLEAVAHGDATFAIDQQPFLQGYLPVSFLALYAQYGLIPASNVASGPNFITKEKATQVMELSAKGIR